MKRLRVFLSVLLVAILLVIQLAVVYFALMDNGLSPVGMFFVVGNLFCYVTVLNYLVGSGK